jgi:hypothetical protein
MTAKQPQAGEWWQQIDGTKYLCIAKNKHDETIWQVKDSGFRSLVGDYYWKHWQHLPDCDSFDWQPEVFTQEELTASYQAIPAADLPPVESPDDWVTQDRVPPRHGIDQVQWSDWESSLWVNLPRGWYPPKIHGYRDEEDDTVLSVRCRRKDLPVMPSPVETPTNQQLFEMIANLRDQMAAMAKPIEVKSQPKRVWVRLVCSTETIGVVNWRMHDDPGIAGESEIKHDGYKFYVEVQR